LLRLHYYVCALLRLRYNVFAVARYCVCAFFVRIFTRTSTDFCLHVLCELAL